MDLPEFGGPASAAVRMAAGRRVSRGDSGAWEKAEFHQPPGFIAGKIDALQDGGIAPAEIYQGGEGR